MLYRTEEFIIFILFSIISYVIYTKGKKKGLMWSHYFAFGVMLLAVAHLFKAIYPDIKAPVDVPPKFAGLIAVLYAMLKEVDHPHTDLLTGLGTVNGVAYAESAILFFLVQPASILYALLVALPHYGFLVIGPLIGTIILYDVFRETKDKLALLFSIGFLVYAIANFMLISSLYFNSLPLEPYYILMIVTSAIGIAIGLGI